jgi:hypothetical protein
MGRIGKIFYPAHPCWVYIFYLLLKLFIFF